MCEDELFLICNIYLRYTTNDVSINDYDNSKVMR